MLVVKYLWSPEGGHFVQYPSGKIHDIPAEDFIRVDEPDLLRYVWMNKAIQEPAVLIELDGSNLQEFFELAKGKERLYVLVRGSYYGLVLPPG